MGALGDPLEEMKDLDDAESSEFRSSLQTNPVHVSLSQTESRRRPEPRMRNLVFSNQHGLQPHRGPGTDRIGRMHFRPPRVSVNVESSRTDAELPSEDAIQGEIAWARPNSNQSSESTLGRYGDESHRRGTLRSVYSSSQENSFRFCRGSRGAYGRAMV